VEEDTEATQLMLEALFDIKVRCTKSRSTFSGRTMDPNKRKRKKTPEEWAADRARHEDILRRLQEMIERYRAINAEKRRRREAEAS